MKRGAGRLALLLLCVFALGGLSGAALVRLQLTRMMRGLLDGPPEELAEKPILWMLDRRVELSAEQRAKAAEILARHREELRVIHRGVAPRLLELRHREAAELMPSLDAGQQARLNELFTQIEAHVQRWLGP